MSRWVLLAVALLLFFPCNGHATNWTLSSRVLTGGGSLQVRNEPVITIANGTVMKTYTTSKMVPVTLTASTGYQISAVSLNGVGQTLPVPNPVSMGLPAFNPIKTAQTITVSYTKALVNVSVSATEGGSVNPTGTFTLQQGTVQTFTFTPNAGRNLFGITGLPSGATLADAGTGATVTLPYAKAVKVTFTVPSTAVAMTGGFYGILANAGPPQTAIVGTEVKLSGSATTYDGSPQYSYLWNQMSGPQQVALTGANTSSPTFTATVAGTYRFQLRVTSSLGATNTATAEVILTFSAPAAARVRCQNCHSTAGIGGGRQVFNKWSSSRHSANVVMCASCHVGADTGAHPGTLSTGTVNPSTFQGGDGANFCLTCHSATIVTDFASSRHSSTVTCSSCHGDAHAALAFSSSTFRTYTAGAFTGRTLCFNCHGAVNSTHYYSKSAIDNICASCHTPSHNPTAFMAAAVGASHFNGYTSRANPSYRGAYVTPRTTCTTCHLDSSGTDGYQLQRQQWAASGHGDNSAAAWKSSPSRIWTRADLCVRCHSAEGYRRFATSGFKTAQAMTEYTDNASEPLTCNACHVAGFKVNEVAPYAMQYTYSSSLAGRTAPDPVSFTSAGTSNVCIPCHTFLVSGENVKGVQANIATGRAPADFWNRTPFIAPHHNGGAANVYGAAGYRFAGQEYTANGNHTGVASGAEGSCIGCHMDSTDHSFKARTRAVCAACHNSAMSDEILASQKNQLTALKSALQMQLSSVKGIKYNRSVDGYFFTKQGAASGSANLFTSWGTPDTMGAAFNLYMMDQDAGAYAHNPSYATKLLRDSLDFVVNGSVDRSRDLFSLVWQPLKQQGMDDTTLALLRDGLSTMASSGSGYCVNCHVPMIVDGTAFANNAAHFSRGTINASYTNLYDCSACHSAHAPGSSIPLPVEPYQSYAREGHAAYTSPVWTGQYDVVAGGDEAGAGAASCARCHNAFVMQSYAKGSDQHAPYTYTQKANAPSVVACAACHSSLDTATNTAQVTQLKPVTTYYNLSSTAAGFTAKVKSAHTYPDAANSNVCVACHSGTASGETITALAARFGNLSSYTGQPVASHALPVAVTLYGNAYHAAGYTAPMLAHDRIRVTVSGDTTTGSGPCAACHNLGKESHSFAAVTTDDKGNITQIANASLCGECHNAMDAAVLNGAKANFQNSIAVLAQLLINKGYISSFTYGGGIPQPNLAGAWGSSAKFGAWFNIDLLTRNDSQKNDPAAYVHNPAYARRLINDAIDIFDDGKANGSAAATIAALAIDGTKVGGLPAGATSESITKSATGYLETDRTGCFGCHLQSVDPQTGRNIVDDYSASPHGKKAQGPSCASCHAPSVPVAHPGGGMSTDTATVSDRCAGCHKLHTWRSAGICTECHNGHTPQETQLGFPHLSNYSTAQYIATNFTCDSCHVDNDGKGTLTFHIYSANADWARSGKGNARSPSYLAFDFKTLGTSGTSPDKSAATDCVRCHTSTGYINYVGSAFRNISAWGVPGTAPGGDRTRQMISCSTCHDPFFSVPRYDEETDSIIPPYNRRKVGTVTAYYNYSTTGSGRVLSASGIPSNAGSSNNCIVCHTGRMSGTALKKIQENVGGASAAFWSDAPFIDPHGMGAAGILYQSSGYTFSHLMREYTVAPAPGHTGLGGFEEGACVACHMRGDQAHLFAAVEKDGDGTITKINAFDEVCRTCHSTAAVIALDNPANLNGKRLDYRASLNALTAVLAGNQIYFNAELAPYFFTVRDKAQQGAATEYRNWNLLNRAGTIYNGADTMGTAFNLRLLWADAGAYTHNDIYVKRLMYDSIDYLDDGQLNGSVYTTIQDLGLTTDDRTRAWSYIGHRP